MSQSSAPDPELWARLEKWKGILESDVVDARISDGAMMTETTKWGVDWRDALAAWRAPKPARMSDAEVVAMWMEPKPNLGCISDIISPLGWWVREKFAIGPWVPFPKNLEGLRLVEARLSNRQWEEYRRWLWGQYRQGGYLISYEQYLLHASAEQKLAALALVLQSEVEEGVSDG